VQTRHFRGGFIGPVICEITPMICAIVGNGCDSS
jgi:hypothetical protein